MAYVTVIVIWGKGFINEVLKLDLFKMRYDIVHKSRQKHLNSGVLHYLHDRIFIQTPIS